MMARIMDQDILPVLLTLRALRPHPRRADLFFAWPGVELQLDSATHFEVDLLVSDGRVAWCYEVKNNATGLKLEQLRRLLETSSKLDARPGIAALEGEFSGSLVSQVINANGRVLTCDDLVAPAI